ncbi:matrix metalloproteinase-17-like isoform X1 [Pantherophis guttatus]|uniref:Matrix metalloproteinase-17-like isoform X1 n=1 Tax=Pantherophis guttatus TaxID=94885 RepID=A0A6P9DCS1_PANGU|nr:matrix metalloproteinase-17-like isoform X1 [Pantherophis guttatus]XP_034292851.1 matrix metalloproteinase-17-like isoform X1 [Pantherophis guttatus]XP_034292852.1 matrix metalloproteinase-17-like isoform X1 [Pantherophis guttatus]XP_034292853.1 matrix metalloproteinase-17-like isoform X1 [Pantherophis guttatus]XP_034292854.1 matrix metalloproteinase-17-like isoform X1 [Pantherophis guttatus]XP_034292855.1 matrix metalloproteinase-17-like isoform X1 [Pantherophis guttatus]XP_034292856.1 ma
MEAGKVCFPKKYHRQPQQQHLEEKQRTKPPAISLHWLLFFLLLPSSSSCLNPAPMPTNETGEVIEWLIHYGYLPPADPTTGQLQTWEAVTTALREMQRFAGIAETGILDDATLSLIRMPRCALPDIIPPEFSLKESARKKRWQRRKSWERRSAGSVLTKRNISWKFYFSNRVKSYPQRARLSRETMRVLIYYALKVWSEAIPLTFHEVGGHTADLSVEFLQLDHHDSYPFDGPGGMVAHSFFPGDPQRAGTVHFDGDEEWTFRSPDDFGTDLFAVAIHEFGHSLGLAHSSSKHSIMHPYYQGPVGDPLQYQLHMEDQAEIQKLYGSKVFHSTEKHDITTPLPGLLSLSQNFPAVRPGKGFPDRCNSSIDAVAQIRGETFFFKDQYFWRLSQSRHLTSPQPAVIPRFWRGLPSALRKVDAVYERPADHRILFFSGPLYWVFKDNGVEEGYPRPITDFGLPQGGISGAFSWPPDQKTYFFKGDLHWCYDETTRHIEEASPLLQESWEQFSSSVDSVLIESDGTLYVFKGQQYWKFDQETLQLQAGYPRSIATDWLDCTVEPLRIMPTSPSLGVKLPPNFQGPQLKIEERVCFCAAFCAISSTLLNVLPLALLTLQGLA